MSNGNNKRFLRNPVKYARKHMMLVGHGLRSTNAAGATPHGDLTAKTNYYSVGKGIRVLYGNIKPTENEYKSTMASGTVDVELRDPPAKQPRDFPVFFLPWAADNVIKIKLSDPRNNPGDEVKIFMTAAVDGCSVFVEGEPGNPTVYHANAMSHNPGGLDPSVAAEMIQLRRARAQQMKDRLTAIRGAKDRYATATGNMQQYDQGTGNMRVAEMADYAPSAVGAMNNADKMRILGSVPKVKVSRMGQGTAINAIKEEVDLAPQINFNGTVFGLKGDNGNWEFYYQRRAMVNYRLPKRGTDLSRTSGWELITYWLPTAVQKFWPDGNGSAVARPMTVVAWPG